MVLCMRAVVHACCCACMVLSMHAVVHAAWALSQSGTQLSPALIHATRHSTALTVLSLSCLCRLGPNRSVSLARTLSSWPPLLGPFWLRHPRDRNHRLGPFGSDPSGSASLARSLDSVLSCGALGSDPLPDRISSAWKPSDRTPSARHPRVGPLDSVPLGSKPSDRTPSDRTPRPLRSSRSRPRRLAALAAPVLVVSSARLCSPRLLQSWDAAILDARSCAHSGRRCLRSSTLDPTAWRSALPSD